MSQENDRDDSNAGSVKGKFRNPPEATRFKKGVSGNPKGRPKGSLNVGTALMRALREKVMVNVHGHLKRVTKFEAAMIQLANKAAGGDLRAIVQLWDLTRETETKQIAAVEKQPSTLNEVDQEVMSSILERFREQTDANSEFRADEDPDANNEEGQFE